MHTSKYSYYEPKIIDVFVHLQIRKQFENVVNHLRDELKECCGAGMSRSDRVLLTENIRTPNSWTSSIE